MVVDGPLQKLRALPAQFIETDEGIVLKRGATAISIGGDRAAAIVHRVLAAAEDGATREEILLLVAQPDREAVDSLVEHLVVRGILIGDGQEAGSFSSPESSLDVFYWNFGSRPELVAQQVDQQRLAIVGVNDISHRLATVLSATGVSNFKV